MNPDRIRLARELVGLTQTDLAKRIGVGQSAIAHMESGRLEPSLEVLNAIADETGVTVDYLERDALPDFPLGSLLLYRAKASVPAREESRVRRQAQLLTEFVTTLWRQVKPLPVRIPQLGDVTAEDAAQITRSTLGLSPDTPVRDLIRTIERAGVLILALPLAKDPIDAFSVWVGDDETPCIVLLADSPADRRRWSVAHELGHLVMHRAMRGSSSDMEREADEFAAEFLAPREAMKDEIPSPVTLLTLRALKSKWRVSMRSLINRALEVGAVSTNQRRYLFIKLNREYGGRYEPQMFLPERPRGIRQLVEMVYGDPPDWARVSADLGVTKEFAMQYFEGYVGANKLGNILTFPRRQS